MGQSGISIEIEMGANPTPKSDEDEATYRRGPREPYTSPIWDNYDPRQSSYVENRASAYGRYYPTERWDEYGCGWETSSRSTIPGWRRALQDPNPAAIGLVIGAIATYLLVRAVPTSFRRKRKRNLDLHNVGDHLWSGLEEFEEKIDKIAEGEDDGENSWISKIYNQFSFFNDGDNSLEENDMDGLEPPLLDETWGLGVRTHIKEIMANATIGEEVPLEEEAGTARGKREAEEDAGDGGEDEVEERCRVAMWRCLSHVVWGGVMAIPEARQIKLCMTEHTECMSYEVLRREAQETLDPNDPMLDMMYRNKRKEDKEEKGWRSKGKVEKPKKRERLIVNPDFVENLDTDDGSVQYNEDLTQNLV